MSRSGLILITSCYKNLETRIKELQVPDSVLGWPVVVVMGDPLMDAEFEWKTNQMLVIKCEDSYYHLIKKNYIAIDIIRRTLPLEGGVIIAGDDIVFNFERLEEFIKLPNKAEYMGNIGPQHGPTKRYCTFMYDYILTHPGEKDDPRNGLKDVDLSKCTELPNVSFISGTIYYVSLSTVQTIINFMKSISWDCFHYDPDYGYITLCEDQAVAAITHKHGILPTFYTLVAHTAGDFETGRWVSFSTNKYH